MLMLFSVIPITLWSQQNLIPNGSFENIREDIQSNIDDYTFCNTPCEEAIPVSHLEEYSEKEFGLVKHWWLSAENGTGTGAPTDGITYLIAPDLYTVTGGNTYDDASRSLLYPLNNDVRAFSALTNTNGTPGLNLQTNVYNGLDGFDCSPPDTKFGSAVFAPEGENYFAIVDLTRESVLGASVGTQGAIRAKPSITCELESPLVKDVDYTFVMTRAMMNNIQTIATNEGWSGGVPDARIEVHLAKDLNSAGEITGSDYQIMDEDFTYTNWETDQWTFTATDEWKYLRVRVNPVGNTGDKISGVFIDNLKLYEACETALNQCNNTNWKRDMLDVQISNFDAFSGLAYPDPNQNNNNFLQTIRVENLQNVKRLELRVIDANTAEIVRYVDQLYPPSEFIWDGNDNNGNPVPEGYYYATITVSNDCFHTTNADVKFFNLKRKYTVFEDVQISTKVISTPQGSITVPAIKGLEEVHWIRVTVANSFGQEVLNQAYYNPPSEMLLSTSFGDISSPPSSSPGTHTVYLEMSNNCQSSLISSDYTLNGQVAIGAYGNYNVDPNLFNWVQTPKPDFTCPYNYQYLDNYLPPRDCCEGNLYIDNVEIYNDFGVQIQNNIIFGDNVTFGVNSTNSFYAGNQIFGEPGLFIPPGSNVLLEAGTYNCAVLRTGNSTTSMDDPENSMSSEFNAIEEVIGESSSALFPNPVKAGEVITLSLLNDATTIESYTLLNGVGKRFTLVVKEVNGNKVTLQTPAALADGMYYLQATNDYMIQSFKVQIQN